MKRFLALVACALAIVGLAACDLNPHPLPPAGLTGNAGSSSGADAGGGAILIGDAAPGAAADASFAVDGGRSAEGGPPTSATSAEAGADAPGDDGEPLDSAPFTPPGDDAQSNAWRDEPAD